MEKKTLLFSLTDFQFVLKGITRLLNNPLMQTYLPNSTKKVHFHQELLVFFWKMCDYNKKFLYYVLKSSDVLEVLVPILYHLNDSRADQCKSLSPIFLIVYIDDSIQDVLKRILYETYIVGNNIFSLEIIIYINTHTISFFISIKHHTKAVLIQLFF